VRRKKRIIENQKPDPQKKIGIKNVANLRERDQPANPKIKSRPECNRTAFYFFIHYRF
jgi:hypothetical protein